MKEKLRSYSSGVEHFLGKEEVIGSIPIMSSSLVNRLDVLVALLF